MSWEFQKLKNLIDAAFQIDNVVVVEMPRGTGKTAFVKWMQNNGIEMSVVVHNRMTKDRDWRYRRNVHTSVRMFDDEFVVFDEFIGDNKEEELKCWLKSHEKSKVLIIGTKVGYFGGMMIVWDPFDAKLRKLVEDIVGHEIAGDMLDPENREKLEKYVGREVLAGRAWGMRK